MTTLTLFILPLMVFCTAMVLSGLITPFFVRLSHHSNYLDRPHGRKKHKGPRPCLGGVVLFVSFWGTIAGGALYISLMENNFSMTSVMWKLLYIFFGSTFVLLLGLYDDREDMTPQMKFLGQAVAAMFLIVAGLRIDAVSITPNLGLMSPFVTLFWLMLLMNAFNFIDSIDGHCVGVALISSVFFFWLTQLLHQALVSLFILALAGSLLGFMRFNAKPAKIFLGDNGSLFLGYIIASITLLCDYHREGMPATTLLIPVIIFGVPLYDLVSVVLVRLARGQAPWKGDRNHFAHRLIRLGMNEQVAVVFSFFVCMTLGLNAILSTQLHTALAIVLNFLVFIMIMGIIAFLEYYASQKIRVIEQSTQKGGKSSK